MTRKRSDRTHDRIVDLIHGLVKANKNTYQRVKKPSTQIEEAKDDIKFQPDVHAYSKRRKGRIDVFEVWYSESWAEAFLDLIYCAAIPQIDWLHIVLVRRERKYRNPWKRTHLHEIEDILSRVMGSKRFDAQFRIKALEVTTDDLRASKKLALRKKIGDAFKLT